MFNFLALGGGGLTLESITIEDRSLGCDPTQGLAVVNWVIGGPTTGLLLDIAYNFDGGSTWYDFQTGIDATLTVVNIDVSGVFGFTTLDAIYFRITVRSGSGDIFNSPRYGNPPYPC